MYGTCIYGSQSEKNFTILYYLSIAQYNFTLIYSTYIGYSLKSDSTQALVDFFNSLR